MKQSKIPFVSVLAFAVFATSSAQANTITSKTRTGIEVASIQAAIAQHIEINMNELEKASQIQLNQSNVTVITRTRMKMLSDNNTLHIVSNSLTPDGVSE